LTETICPEDLVKLIPPTRAAVLLLVAALAACSDAPTGAAITAADHPATFNIAPTVTVTNSGGYPLISWGALAGATSYTVARNENATIIYKATLDSRDEVIDTPLTTTTATSYLDVARTYTGDTSCVAYGTYQSRITLFRYRVTANYPTGTATTYVAAPISPC
jgi:hypothetical protein